MRKIYRQTLVISAALFGVLPALAGTAAHAQTGPQYFDQSGQPIFLPNTSSSYNQQGFNLPSMPSQNGQDIVRGSGGISCQSAIGSGGPKLDMGVIGSNDIFDREAASVYGRISIPLGKRPKRVDCSKLYDLEISRLKMELQLMRAGAVGMSDMDSAKNIALQASRGQMPAPKEAQVPVGLKVADNSQPFVLGGSNVAEVKPAPMKSIMVSENVNVPIRTAPRPAALPKPQQQRGAQPTLAAGMISIANYGKPATDSGYFAQIGAFSSIENAKNAWWEYTQKVPGEFTDYTALAKPKRKGDKTLYLLQAGPFTKQDTKRLCKSLNNDCYPVRT